MKNILHTVAITVLFYSCQNKIKTDLIIHNAKIYTVDSIFSIKQAVAIKDGKILSVGSDEEILEKYEGKKIEDLDQKPVFPGFYDAHCHFFGYAENLRNADLKGCKTEDEMILRVLSHRTKFPKDNWILGRGWDQNLWPDQQFPEKHVLDSLFPDKPVFLRRIDGHAAFVNQKALDMAQIDINTSIDGGEIITENDQLTGLLIDRAVGLVYSIIPKADLNTRINLYRQAQQQCLSVGLTTLAVAGLSLDQIQLADSLTQSKDLILRFYAMLQPTQDCFDFAAKQGQIIKDNLHINSFKVYCDGALGSRGACLISDYSDDPGNSGFLVTNRPKLDLLANKIDALGFQMNTHAIGDSANRTMLDIYSKYLQGNNDKRWRIEHAQIVHPDDVGKFAQFDVIPSVQPTHCTSDMYWADERLGENRIQYAYTYKTLLDSYGKLALGSDFPVEDINPLYGFHAAVARVDGENYPEGGFQMKDAISREEALKGMTIWAAYACFEESNRGSIEVGKLADLVVLESDIMEIPLTEIRNTSVNSTWINGVEVYMK